MRRLICILIVLCFVFSCSQEENKTASNVPAPEVKDIYSVEVNLPDSAGAELFRTNCGVCHSLRYIEMQPAFPRKTWEKTVDKMIKTFDAPISDSSSQKIVNYLMAVRGKK